MNLAKTEKAFALMKAYGVSYFKDVEMEVRMEAVIPVTPVTVPLHVEHRKEAPPLQAVPPVENKIPHHVNEVAQMLKLSDNELVDRLFPEEKPGAE